MAAHGGLRALRLSTLRDVERIRIGSEPLPSPGRPNTAVVHETLARPSLSGVPVALIRRSPNCCARVVSSGSDTANIARSASGSPNRRLMAMRPLGADQPMVNGKSLQVPHTPDAMIGWQCCQSDWRSGCSTGKETIVTISDDTNTFFGKTIVQYEAGEPIDLSGKQVYRLSLDYDDTRDMPGLISEFLSKADKARLDSLIIGMWGEPY